MSANAGGSLVAFRSRDFSLFWFSALVSNSAQWMQQITIPFIVYELTESNSWVGMIAFALLIPALIFTPVAGILADRVPRAKVLIYTTSTQFLVAMGFMTLWQLDELTPFVILGLSLIQGMSAGLQITNWQTLIPQLVPEKHLFSAIRLNSAQFTASRALGPLTGALILGIFGPGAVFLTNAITYLLLMMALLTIQPRILPSRTTARAFAALKEGYQYVLKRAAIGQAIITAFAISFLGQSLVQLAAGLASERYDVGSTGLAGFVTASGVGTIFGSAWVIAYGDRVQRSKMVMLGLGIYATGPILVGLTTLYTIGLLGYFISGIAHMIVGISLNTAVQSQLPDIVRGRVISVYLMGVFGGIPLGSLFGGRLGDAIGLERVFLGYGIALGLYLLLVATAYKGHHLLDSDTDVLLETESDTDSTLEKEED